MRITSLLATSRYFIVNKDLIKLIGTEETVLLGELISERDYWLSKEQLEDDFFYSTIENIENEVGYNEYKQRKLIKSLENKGIIETKIKGLPAKRYIRIIEEQLIEILNIDSNKNLRTSSLNFKELEPENLRTNNNNIKIINNNNNIISNYNRHNIYNYIEENFGRLLSPIEYEKINIWSENYNEEIIKKAVKIAVLNRKSTFAYVEGILKNWKAKGYSSLNEIIEEEENAPINNSTISKEDEDLLNYDWLNDN